MNLPNQNVNFTAGDLNISGQFAVGNQISQTGHSSEQLPAPKEAEPSPKRILLLSANPQLGAIRESFSLNLEEEMRQIKEGLRRSKGRDRLVLERAEAVRYRDLHRAILDFEPNIIHFSGHGAGETGLVFASEIGRPKPIDGDALANLFSLFADQIECIVLNACYSQIQAEAMAQAIDYVIGMNDRIGDRAAIEFSIGFYDALGSGKSYDFAYQLGCRLISLAGISEDLTPVLLGRSQG